jgi:hypothetical protein
VNGTPRGKPQSKQAGLRMKFKEFITLKVTKDHAKPKLKIQSLDLIV